MMMTMPHAVLIVPRCISSAASEGLSPYLYKRCEDVSDWGIEKFVYAPAAAASHSQPGHTMSEPAI